MVESFKSLMFLMKLAESGMFPYEVLIGKSREKMVVFSPDFLRSEAINSLSLVFAG